jgi:hypothetical protein
VVQHTRGVYLKQNLVERAPVSKKTLYLGKDRNMIKCFKGMPVTRTEEIKDAHKYFWEIPKQKNWKN